MISRSFVTGFLFLVGLSSPVLAQVAECEPRGTNGMVTAVLCPAGLDTDAWQKAGKAACEERKPCGAWIWVDESYIPKDLPDSHDKLPTESVKNAVAIWVNENSQLITLEKAN